MAYAPLSAQTVDELNKLFDANATKAGISQGTGITAYQLEEFVKTMVPEFTPIRDSIPRVTPPGNLAGTQPNWKQNTSFNLNKIRPFVNEGQRGALLTYNVTPKSAPYVTLGLENNATFEAEAAAIGFDNVDQQATLGLMQEVMAQEERVIIGGNAGLALGTPGTIVLTEQTSGGTLVTATTYYVGVVALTFDGFYSASATGVNQTLAQANAGPYGGTTTINGGTSIPSATASLLTTGPSHSIVATVPAVTGAVGYAWYISTTASGTSHQYFVGTSTINSYNFTVPGVATQQDFAGLAATDYSKNALSFDGLISEIAQGGYNYVMPTGTPGLGGAGTGLTPAPTGAGVGIVEFETVLAYMWTNYNTNIDEIYVNSQEMNNITNKVLSSGSAPLIRFNYSREEIQGGKVIGGAVVGFYLNKYAMGGPTMIPIILHPYVPAGTVLFRPVKLPYRYTNVGTILRMNCRRDYYQMTWPVTARQREWGTYVEEVLQNYAPFAFASITNIANK